ncbi:MAG: TIGR03905 family TSCPD domain-containing protein [Sphaerochaetaceae bacterium]
MKTLTYIPHGVCARKITVTMDDNQIIEDVQFEGGCDGNHTGIERLAKGHSAQEVARLLEGVTCGGRPTSCPDQLARALREAL